MWVPSQIWPQGGQGWPNSIGREELLVLGRKWVLSQIWPQGDQVCVTPNKGRVACSWKMWDHHLKSGPRVAKFARDPISIYLPSSKKRRLRNLWRDSRAWKILFQPFSFLSLFLPLQDWIGILLLRLSLSRALPLSPPSLWHKSEYFLTGVDLMRASLEEAFADFLSLRRVEQEVHVPRYYAIS